MNHLGDEANEPYHEWLSPQSLRLIHLDECNRLQRALNAVVVQRNAARAEVEQLKKERAALVAAGIARDDAEDSIRQQERERCAMVCEKKAVEFAWDSWRHQESASSCAAAIRALGDEVKP